MPSRIRIGPDGGPYVIVEENNGDLDITTPDDTIDLQNSGLINATLSGVLDAQNNDISNVGALTADSVSTSELSVEESGVVDHGSVPADGASDVTVSFNNTYTNPPIVLHEAGSSVATGVSGKVTSLADEIGTSGFRSIVTNLSSSSSTTLDQVGYVVLVP